VTLTYTFRDGTTTQDVIAWALKYEDNDYRHVKYDEIHTDEGLAVSTIWQGLPVFPDSPPEIFSTAVLSLARGQIVIWEVRTGTEEQALAVHGDLVQSIYLGHKPWEEE
jgi:hypothetical protein